MVEFNRAEERFLKKNELGRLATISPDGMPHVVPVSYVYQAGDILIATDYETKKYRNLRANNRVAFVVDVYRPNRGDTSPRPGQLAGKRLGISRSLPAILQKVQLGKS